MDNEDLYIDQVHYYQWIYDRHLKGNVPFVNIKMALEQHQAKVNIGNMFQRIFFPTPFILYSRVQSRPTKICCHQLMVPYLLAQIV